MKSSEVIAFGIGLVVAWLLFGHRCPSVTMTGSTAQLDTGSTTTQPVATVSCSSEQPPMIQGCNG